MLRFDGKTAIVTGAGRGIGRAHATLLASRGARVVVADYGTAIDGTAPSAGPADDVVAEIVATGGEAVACFASVADPNGARRIVETVMDAYGRLDILVNNAGITHAEHFDAETPEKFQAFVGVHYLGTVYTTMAAWPHLKASGAGRVVNTSSEASFGIHRKSTSYGSIKAGVFGFTRNLAADQRGSGVLVNAIAPRASTRQATPDILGDVFSAPAEKMGRFHLDPALVAPLAAYLAHESCTLNGEMFAVGGGQVQRIIVSSAPGIHSPDLTPEYIAANLDRLLDSEGAKMIAVNAAHDLVHGGSQ